MKLNFYKLILITSIAASGQQAFSQEKSPWKHESEAAVVKVDGNTTSESYSAKQKTIYTFDANALTAAGRYLQTRAGGTETAKSWDASLRYERLFSDLWSTFLQHGAESDFYAGYIQRDNTDVGAKYYFTKSETQNLFSELGYRYSTTIPAGTGGKVYDSFGRLYTEFNSKVTETLSAKLWVEYLPNFREADAYLVNYEPSASVMINSIFSLKVAYLVKYHNKTVTATEKKEDTTFTTALVAKF